MAWLMIAAMSASAVMATVQGQGALAYTDLKIGMAKSELAALAVKQGASLQCQPVTKAEVPIHAGEACRLSAGADTAATFLIAPDQAGRPRMIAYSLTAPVAAGADMVSALSRQLGQPTRALDTAFGRAHVWLQAGRQVSYRDACAPGRFCLEVSNDAFARRVARSTGLFVAATPGT